ncbi:MAG: molybdopterin cofactor-binding domain-containing protein [Pseudomonadota bacterium]
MTRPRLIHQRTPTSGANGNVPISRRELLTGIGALTFAIGGSGLQTIANAADEDVTSIEKNTSPNAWLTIHGDGAIDIIFPSTEMGQGSSTYLPMMLAEELDADWARVRIQQLNSDDRRFGNPIFGGFLYTAGSSGVYAYMPPMRMAGAQARRMLIATAAKAWSVPAKRLHTAPGKVIDPETGQELSYGELAVRSDFVTAIPDLKTADLKSPDDFRLIGRSVPRRDIPGKTNGTATFAIDVRVPEMLYAAVLRAPVEGETPASIDDQTAKSTTGVVDVVTLPDGIAVVAETMWAAFQARDALNVTWTSTSALRSANSTQDLEAYATAAESDAKAAVWHETGDAKSKILNASHQLSNTYKSDYAYHAQLEPMAVVASVTADGKAAEIWAGTQTQSWTTATATSVLETSADRIKLNMMTMGGSFGRRTALTQEYVRDALLASKAAGRPVKVVWTREDDLKFGWFRPTAAQRMSAGLDNSGKVTGWHHRVATPSVIAYFNPRRWEQVEPKDIISMRGAENKFYDFADVLAEHVIAERRARIIPWRAIGASYTAFAAEAFMDELAAKAGKDPLEFRISHTANNASGQRLLRTVAKMADWSRRRSDTALGLAYAGYGHAQAAGIAEIRLNRETGEIRVENFWAAIDAGLIIAPDNALNQIEGGVVFGVSSALKEQVTIVDGEVEQQNFGDYQILRANETPRITVELIRDGPEPLQVGEVGTPMVAPAIANAFARLTAKRLRHMPFTPERVLAALA